MSANRTKAWILAACMVAVAGFSALGKPGTQAAMDTRARVPLEDIFPSQVGDWRLDPAAAVFVRPAVDQARRFQMYDQVLERTYINGQGQRLMLSVAYGRQQSVGLQMHRPEVCYQAGGFQVQDVRPETIQVLGQPFPVTRLQAHMDGRPEPITYWRLLGDGVVTDDSSFKLQQLSLGLRGRVLDGLLVRVSSIDRDTDGAHRRQARFADELARAMSPVQRQRAFGVAPAGSPRP
ncbi:exosortase-associated protein EpsI, B-type [Aquabacterium sp.]|uniref:exosortase-associated protein EpsI, B-type n=1 Tax=Aquabacterium sp. TaxID=1872578 RepID=UPI003D6C7ABE